MKKYLSILCAAVALSAIPSCATATPPPDGADPPAVSKPAVISKPAISADLLDGVCLKTEDGKYGVCYNPLFETVTVKTTDGTGQPQTLTYSEDTKDWRYTFPDGRTVVYKKGQKPRIEAPLPVPT